MTIDKPTTNTIIIFNHLYDFTISWYNHTKKFPKFDRYTLAQKIFLLLLDTLTQIQQTKFQKMPTKLSTLNIASQNFDMVKILIRLCHTLELIEQSKYIQLENELQFIGRQLGGWLNYLNQLPNK